MIDKAWFNHLGKYDSAMDIWGGENFGESLFFLLCLAVLASLPESCQMDDSGHPSGHFGLCFECSAWFPSHS